MPCRCADYSSLLEVLPAVGGWRWAVGGGTRRQGLHGPAARSAQQLQVQ